MVPPFLKGGQGGFSLKGLTTTGNFLMLRVIMERVYGVEENPDNIKLSSNK